MRQLSIPRRCCLPDQDGELVYNVTKTINEQFDSHVKIEPWSAGRKTGRISSGSYLITKARSGFGKGLWSDEAQAHNDKLVKREGLLAQAWEGRRCP